MTRTTEQVLAEQQRQAEADWEREHPDPEDELDYARATTRGDRALAPIVPADDDGWAEEANSGDRLLKGNLLRFADRQWTFGRDARPMLAKAQLVALKVTTAWVRWSGKKPAGDVRVRIPGQPFPVREELGYTDETQWELRPDGSPADPWQLTKHVYLVNIKSGELFTYVTTSGGGFGAIADLADQVQFMRAARPGAVPVLEPDSADMETRYGRKSRPVLRIVGWRGGEELAQIQRPTTSELLADEVPF
jgi:hypothetical protein